MLFLLTWIFNLIGLFLLDSFLFVLQMLIRLYFIIFLKSTHSHVLYDINVSPKISHFINGPFNKMKRQVSALPEMLLDRESRLYYFRKSEIFKFMPKRKNIFYPTCQPHQKNWKSPTDFFYYAADNLKKLDSEPGPYLERSTTCYNFYNLPSAKPN